MAKRRGHGEGTITKRSDGRWMAQLTLGTDGDGKRRRLTVYGKSQREVREKLDALKGQNAAGTLTDAGAMTVAEWLEHWLERISRPEIRPTTYVSYRNMVDQHLTPRIGSVRLGKLSAVHVQDMYGNMEAAGMSARMRQIAHSVLHRACRVAVRRRLIVFNPCAMVDRPKYTRPEMKTLTPDEAQLLLTESEGDRFHALIVLAVTTGMRQGELFGLQWGDIDLKAGTLAVRRTLVEVKGKLSFGPPKSKSSVRRIQLPALAVAALTGHRALMLREGHAAAETVFCDSQGGMLRKSNFYRKYFKPLLKRAGVSDIRFHDLRHTSATMLLADGVHPKIVQQRLGHSQIALTLDTYSHVLPSMDEAAAGTFDRMLKPDQKRKGTPA